MCDLFTRHKISKPLKVPLPCNINLRCHQRNILSHNASAAGLSVEDVVGLPETAESWNLRSKEFVLMPTSPALLTFKVHSCATQALGNITLFDVEPLILATKYILSIAKHELKKMDKCIFPLSTLQFSILPWSFLLGYKEI